MNKAELVSAIAEKTELKKVEVSKRAAREGRNPQTKKTIKIPASNAAKFKAGKALKDAINTKTKK